MIYCYFDSLESIQSVQLGTQNPGNIPQLSEEIESRLLPI